MSTSTSKPLKPKRGTTAQNNTYTGEAYEVTLDTDKKTLVVHDGLTAGGFPLAKEGDLNTFKTTQSTRDSQQDSAIQQAATAASNAANAASSAQSSANTANNAISALATVARTGSYNDLSNKPSIPATPKAYITETWHSGTEWYDKYSDGKIVQGGVVAGNSGQVSFPLAYSNKNYNILVMTSGLTVQYTQHPMFVESERLETGIKIRVAQYNASGAFIAGYTHYWRTEGY